MKIQDLIQKNPERTAEFEFQDGIFLKLRFVSRSQLKHISKECETRIYDPKINARVTQTDPRKFAAAFCSAAVVSWRGVTPRSISKLVVINDVPAEEMDKEIPFSADALTSLVTEAYKLDNFIQETAMDAANFQTDAEQEIKNSLPSPSGS